MVNEKTSTDQLVRRFIEDIGVKYDEQGSSDVQVKEALKNASKSETQAGNGKPEFIFLSGSHLIIVEDKMSLDKLKYKNENGIIITDYPYRRDYAVNGAVHYAMHIINKTLSYKEVIAVGVAGDRLHYRIKPYFVSKNEIKELPDIKSFEDLSPENIEEFYHVAIQGGLPKEERELKEVIK